MGRQPRKQSVEEAEAKEDLLFLLSNVRARQNGLVFFLELFTNNNHSKLGSEQFKIYKQQFLQKQKIYTSQIKQLLEKMLTIPLIINSFRSFWIKLKSIIRVSLERARTMGLLADSLATRYDQIMRVIDEHHEASSGIKQYLQIQQLIKKRTIEALMASKTSLIEHATHDIAKNRSETFIKMQIKPVESLNFSPPHKRIQRIDDQTSPAEVSSTLHKLKSLTRVKRRGEKSKAKLTPAELKKAHTNIMKYQRNVADLMDARFDFNIDKKKSRGQNETALYQTLFDKNIANHKIITKYVHTNAKLSQIILNLRKVQSRQRPILTQNKLNKKARQEVSQTVAVGRTQESKPKISRPKTSKNPKSTIVVKSRGQGGYQLIKVM